MLLTHRLFLLILISTSAVIATDSEGLSTSLTDTTTTPVLSNSNLTSDSTSGPITATVATSISTGNTSTTPIPNNVTTPLQTTRRGDVTSLLSSTQGNVTSSPTTALVNATSSSVSTAGSATTSPAPVDNTTSPFVPTVWNSTAPGVDTTTHLPEPGSSTTPPQTTSGNDTSPPISTPGNTTASPNTTPSNVTITAQTTSGNATTANHATASLSTTHVTTPENDTTGNTAAPPITTPVNATTPPFPTPGNTTTGDATSPALTTPVNATTPPLTTPGNNTTGTCPLVPCPQLSVCVNSVCQCLAGTVLVNNACVETKTFPSSLRVNRTFVNAMNDPTSVEFQTTANEIMAAVNEAMRTQPNYINCTVVRLTAGSVVATVNTFFDPSSSVTQELVSSTINTAIQECGKTNCGILANAEYTESNLCDQNPPPCDADTTVCNAKDGSAVCPCIAGYVPSPYQSKSCRVCPSGSKAQNDECVPCSFGYSGFNCNDSSLLALVVVACVLGGLLLIVILAVIIYFCMSSRKKSNSNYYSSPYPAEDFRAGVHTGQWSSQDISHIPRATLTSSSSNDAFGNSLEMSEALGKKGQNNGLSGSYDLASDGMRTFKDPNPTRYSYLVGHENPYFIQGDEKR